MKYAIAVVLTVVAAIAGYFGIRHLTRKDLGFTQVKRYATKLANTLTSHRSHRRAGSRSLPCGLIRGHQFG